jgi:hypothetical protein
MRLAAVVDKGRPIKLGNLTFTWQAPMEDMGPIKIQASIAYNDAYVLVESKEIKFNKFPVSEQQNKKN